MSNLREHAFELRGLLSGQYYCIGCAGRVCDAITLVDGVTDASCDLDVGVLSVTFEPHVIPLHELEALVVRLALEEGGRVGHAAYRLTGLD